MKKKPWYAQKTLWVGLGLIVTGVTQGVTSGDVMQAIPTVLTGIAVITGRQAIESVKQ